MNKKFLRLLAISLSVCFTLGASSCELVDTVKSWFGEEKQEEQENTIKGTPEENAAFAIVKAAYENSSRAWLTKGITMSGESRQSEKDANGESLRARVYSNIVSVDVENKIGFTQQDVTNERGICFNSRIEKLFKQDGEYYTYYEHAQVLEGQAGASCTSQYQPIASKPLEYLFENELFFSGDVFDCSGAFLAKDFDTLKKGYAELSWEMSERQRKWNCGWSLEEIEEKLYKISRGESVSFDKFYTEEELKTALEKQKTTFENLKKEAEKIKAEISVTAYEKGGYATLEIKNQMQSGSRIIAEIFGELSMTFQIKARDGKIVGGYEFDGFNKWKNGEFLSGGYQEVEIEISENFAQEQYDEIETVITADTELEEVRDVTLDKDLTLDIGGLSYPMEFEINSQTTVEELFADWTKGIYFSGQFEEEGEQYKCVTWDDLYLDEAKTQKFNPASVTIEEFLKIEKLYTDFTVNDGYAVFVTSTHFFNGLSEKYKYLYENNGEIENPLDVQFEFRKLKAQEGKKEPPYHLDSYISDVGGALGEHGDDAEVYVNGQRITDEDFEFEFDVKNKGYTKVKVIAYEKDWNDWWGYFQSFNLYEE